MSPVPSEFTGEVIINLDANPGLVVSRDGTTTGEGAFVVNQADASYGNWFGLWDPNNSLYYGISQELPSPNGTSTVGGYYHGLGVGGSSSGSGYAIFGVLSSSQSSNGIGATAFTIFDNNKIETFNSRLDDGSGNMKLGGGLATPVTTKTSNYSIGGSDSTVLLNGATLTATLPDATSIAGRIYTVKQISNSTGTVATTSSQTIDGVTTKSLAQYKFITVQSDGSNWFIIASN